MCWVLPAFRTPSPRPAFISSLFLLFLIRTIGTVSTVVQISRRIAVFRVRRQAPAMVGTPGTRSARSYRLTSSQCYQTDLSLLQCDLIAAALFRISGKAGQGPSSEAQHSLRQPALCCNRLQLLTPFLSLFVSNLEPPPYPSFPVPCGHPSGRVPCRHEQRD